MPPKDAGEKPIGDNSTIKLGLALILASYISLSSWWASSMDSKLSVLVSGQQAANGDLSNLKTRVEALERISDQFVQFGSPALRVRIDALEKLVATMEKEFELHRITTIPNGKTP